MSHIRRRSRAVGAASPRGDAAAVGRIPRRSALGACLTCSLVAFAGGWLSGTTGDDTGAASEVPVVESGQERAAPMGAAPTAVVLEDQAGPTDPRELLPLPGPGPDDGVTVPEECLPMEGDGEPIPMPGPGPGGTGPGGGPQELIPLEPVPRQGPGAPAPAPGGPSPAPRDPPGTLRADDLTPRHHDTAPHRGGTA